MNFKINLRIQVTLKRQLDYLIFAFLEAALRVPIQIQVSLQAMF